MKKYCYNNSIKDQRNMVHINSWHWSMRRCQNARFEDSFYIVYGTVPINPMGPRGGNSISNPTGRADPPRGKPLTGALKTLDLHPLIKARRWASLTPPSPLLLTAHLRSWQPPYLTKWWTILLLKRGGWFCIDMNIFLPFHALGISFLEMSIYIVFLQQ